MLNNNRIYVDENKVYFSVFIESILISKRFMFKLKMQTILYFKIRGYGTILNGVGVKRVIR